MQNYVNKYPDSNISESDLISSIQEGNEYVLSALEGVIRGKFSDMGDLKIYLDQKVEYGHINKREEDGEIIYYSNPERYTIDVTKKVFHNILFGKRLFNPNEEIKIS